MNQTFLKFFACLLVSVPLTVTVFAGDLPFTDVSPSDDYYSDLVNLYERGIITDSVDGRFNPGSLMNRDDFVSIVVGVGCKKCLYPTYEDMLKYTTLPFVDFQWENRNFYCVSYAKEQGIVEGYVADATGKSSCQDGQTYSGTPFCAFNKITRIEAAAVLLRQAWLWNNTLNTQAFERKMTLPDTPADWYGYAQKAIEVGIVTADSTGKIRPSEYISRREFVRMAANIFRVNLCSLRSNDGSVPISPIIPSDPNAPLGISSEIRILDSDKSCSKDMPVTTFPDPKDTSYTFFGRTDSPGWPYVYSWDFVRAQDGKHITASGACLPNFDLGTDGTWTANLTITDTSTGISSHAVSTIEIQGPTNSTITNQSGLSVSIDANKLNDIPPSYVMFTSAVNGGKGPYTYLWDFGDGASSTGPNPSHMFDTPGTRNVKLTVTDANGTKSVSSVVLVFRDPANGVHPTVDVIPSTSTGTSTGTTTVTDTTTTTGTSTGSTTVSDPKNASTLPGVSSEIRILDSDKSCSKDTPVTTFPDPKDTTYTFCGWTDSVGWPYSYGWEFTKLQDGTKLTASGAWLPNFDLKTDGTWLVRLTVTDTTTGATSRIVSTVDIAGNSTHTGSSNPGRLTLSARADKLVANAPSSIQFLSTLTGGTGPYTYRWDFADGSFSTDQNPPHSYVAPGPRTVQLTVYDAKWATAIATVALILSESPDLDGDGVLNPDDLCPTVVGPVSNLGCPVLSVYNGDTPSPDATDSYVPGLSLTLAGVNGQCNLSYATSAGAIFGTPACTVCPCQFTAGFNAAIRSCDVIFPAIMSRNKDTVFSRGKVFEVHL